MSPRRAALAIGCDLGATSTRAGLVDTSSGRILVRHERRSTRGDYRLAVAALAADFAALDPRRRYPVGLAIAAQLDGRRRRVVLAPNLGWRQQPLATDLERTLLRPVTLENDVRAAALGELCFGGLRGTKSAVCLFWGSGIGGAIVMAGEVVTGSRALAGEIGHLVYRAGGKRCTCGKRGCYEAYAGGHVLDRAAKKRFGDAAGLVKAAAAGDQAAEAILARAVSIVGQLIASLASAFDPECVLIGGSLGQATFRRLAPAVRPHLVPAGGGKLTLRRAKLGPNAGLLGAAVFATNPRSARYLPRK